MSQTVFNVPLCPQPLSALGELLESHFSQYSCLDRHMEGRFASGMLTASAKNLLITLPIQQVVWPVLDWQAWTTILTHRARAR